MLDGVIKEAVVSLPLSLSDGNRTVYYGVWLVAIPVVANSKLDCEIK